MLALIAAIAMHAIRVNHEFEFLVLFLKCIHKPQSVLEMDVIISRPVSQFQHDAAIVVFLRDRIILRMSCHPCFFVAFRISERSIHETLGVVGVIQSPLIHSPASDSVMEGIGMIHDKQRSHGTAEREALYANLVWKDVWQALEIPCPLHEIPNLQLVQLPVYLVESLPAVMSGCPAIGNDFDYSIV